MTEKHVCAVCSPSKPIDWKVKDVTKLFWGYRYFLQCRNGHLMVEQRTR